MLNRSSLVNSSLSRTGFTNEAASMARLRRGYRRNQISNPRDSK